MHTPRASTPRDGRKLRRIPVAHFYHVYCAGSWIEPVTEHLAALDASGYEGAFIVGLVGSSPQREAALRQITATRGVDRVIHAADGAEQVTVNEVDRYADDHEGAVMYAHTKGASIVSSLQTKWRRRMTENVVLRRRECEDSLARGRDAAGCYWLAADKWPGGEAPHHFWGWGHFSGNFWVARCAFLRTLPAPSMASRLGAEAWLGSGAAAPRVLELLPGATSPGFEELARRRALSDASKAPA